MREHYTHNTSRRVNYPNQLAGNPDLFGQGVKHLSKGFLQGDFGPGEQSVVFTGLYCVRCW